MKKKYLKYILFQNILFLLFIKYFFAKSFPIKDTDSTNSNIIINKNLRKNSNKDFNILNKDISIIIC